MEVNIPETVQWRASAEARYHTTERTIEFLCHKSAASEVDDTKTRDSGADVNQDVRHFKFAKSRWNTPLWCILIAASTNWARKFWNTEKQMSWWVRGCKAVFPPETIQTLRQCDYFNNRNKCVSIHRFLYIFNLCIKFLLKFELNLNGNWTNVCRRS